MVNYRITVPPFREILPDGRCYYNMTTHQLAAMESKARFTWLLCGRQYGKTILLPVWMQQKISEHGPGDYLAGSTNFPLMDKKLLPAFDELFHTILKWGKYRDRGSSIVSYDGKTRIMFFTAEKPSSIESATAISAVLDEVGQDEWKEKTWDAVQGRLAVATRSVYEGGLGAGEVLGATTLYNFGWLKYKIYDEWLRGNPLHNVIHADSMENPTFPPEEYERLQHSMPEWQFNLFYRGRYSKPAGLIYDSFDTETCILSRSRWPVRPEWARYCGMDFGDDTAVIFYAVDPTTGFLYADAEYKERGKSTQEHVEALRQLSKNWNIIKCCGGKGDPGDDGWRGDFTKSGWRVSQPSIRPVEQGIQRVYNFHKTNRLFVLDELDAYLKEKMSYSYKLDETSNPTGDIENKQRYHLMDAERYILSEFSPNFGQKQKLTVVRV